MTAMLSHGAEMYCTSHADTAARSMRPAPLYCRAITDRRGGMRRGAWAMTLLAAGTAHSAR